MAAITAGLGRPLNGGVQATIRGTPATLAVSTAEQILFIGPTETGLFGGEVVTGASVIVMYTYAGDVNFDGLIDASDYGIIDNYFQFPGTTGYANGDFNYDGKINVDDYGIIDFNIGIQGVPFSTTVAVTGPVARPTAVPEPAAGLLFAAALFRRRRRRERLRAKKGD